MTELLLLAAGVILLYVGAELLVKGAAELALGFGLRASTVGVTVVAFATTAPELFVAVLGAITVSTDIGLGTIVGSNIANIGLVLGLSALIRPLDVSDTVVARQVPFMVLAAVLLVALGWDGRIGPIEGGILLAALAGFTLVVILRIRKTQAGISAADRKKMPDPRAINVAYVVGGLVALLAGSRWLINGGRGLLVELGFSDLFIGLTIIAIGTSLPELAASVVAAFRGEASFSVGNVVGSNIYNVLAVIGILAILTPVSVSPGVRAFEFPMLLLFTGLIVGLMLRGRRLTRVDGAVLVAAYVGFVYLLLP